MAKVTVGKVGSTMREVEANTVAEAVKAYGLNDGKYTVKVNNVTVDDTRSLSDGEFVTIGEKVKGGLK